MSTENLTRQSNGWFLSCIFAIPLRSILWQKCNLKTTVYRNVMQSHVVKIMETGKLVGNTAKFSFLEPITWVLKFKNGAEFSNFSLCRIIKENQLIASTNDHGEWFGLNEPYNAETELNNLVSNSVVTEVFYGSSKNDLVFSMSNGIAIEILSVSTGYESWEYRTKEGTLYVATGSGNINEL